MPDSAMNRVVGMLLLAIALAVAPAMAFAQDAPVEDAGAVPYAQTERETRIEREEQEVQAEERADDPYDQREQETTVREQRVEVEGERGNWMFIIGRSAFMGGIVGGLVGVGAYLLSGLEWDPWTIAQFGGGGILLGALAGLVEVIVREDTFAARSSSVDWMERDMPNTYRFNLFRMTF